jgi:hypothetical protein
MPNLIEGVLAECNRVRGIVPYYEEIGPAGAIGAALLKAAIAEGEAAIASGDLLRMIRAFRALQDCEA